VELFCFAVAAASGQDLATLKWGYSLVHYPPMDHKPAFDAWVINGKSSKDDQKVDTLAGLLTDIAHQQNTSVAHFYLGRDLVLQPPLQKAVMDYVSAQPEFQKHPPPAGVGRWEFKNGGKMRALIGEGLMHSPFVAECNVLLGKYGKSVRSVSMEKLFFTKKDDQWGWDAMVWLMIDPSP
jgi:hypothetical protein